MRGSMYSYRGLVIAVFQLRLFPARAVDTLAIYAAAPDYPSLRGIRWLFRKAELKKP